MDLVKSPEGLAELAENKREENWKFRFYLRSPEISSERIDALVTSAYREIYPKIDCTACGNCCKSYGIVVRPNDVPRLAEGTGLSPGELKEKYLAGPDADGEYLIASEDDAPCPFLKDNCCTVYASRPGICREFPHLDEPGFVGRSMITIANASVCPIVYNVLEKIKEDIWKDTAHYRDFAAEVAARD